MPDPQSQKNIDYIPAVWVTQKPLIASPYLDYVPSNCRVLTDINSWILDFDEIESIYGVEFSRKGMRYYKPQSIDHLMAIQESMRMAAILKSRFLGIDLKVEPVEAREVMTELHTHLLKTWRIHTITVNSYMEKKYITNFIPHFPNRGFLSYFIPRVLEIVENIDADFRSYVRFRSYNARHTVSCSPNTFHIEIYFALFQSPTGNSYTRSMNEEIYNKLATFGAEIVYCSSKKSILYAEPILRQTLLMGVMSQLEFLPCLEVNITRGECPFPTELKLPESFGCPGEIFSARPKSGLPHDYVEFGHKLNYGVASQLKGTHLIDAFTQHGSIFGTTGMGKTTFFLNIMDQINAKRPDVGFLIINLAKSNQIPLFGPRVDQIVIYGDDLCHIPYYVEMPVPREYALRNPEEALSINSIGITSAMITAGLGLGNPVDSILKIILEKFYQMDKIPRDIISFLNVFDQYIEKHPYGRDYQPNLRQYFTNRKLALMDKTLIKTMAYYKNQIPLWFKWWREGKSIMLDLSPCQDKRRQRFLMFGILNLIRVLTVNDCNPSQKLKSVVFIDEAKRFLVAPPAHDPHDDEAQALAMTREINSQTMAEARERGIGFFNADTSPGDLIESAWKIPALKICFSLNGKEASLLTEDQRLPQHIEALRKYQALIINSTSGEKYMIQTEPPVLVTRVDKMPAVGEEWWLYQKAVNNSDYINPAIFENQMEGVLSDHIVHDLKRGKVLKVARVSHCLANNGLRMIVGEDHSVIKQNHTNYWDAVMDTIHHFGILQNTTSVPVWALALLPHSLICDIGLKYDRDRQRIYETGDAEFENSMLTIMRIDQMLLEASNYGTIGEALVPLVAIHSHMLARLLGNLQLWISNTARLPYRSLLVTLKEEGFFSVDNGNSPDTKVLGDQTLGVSPSKGPLLGGIKDE